MKFLDYFDEYCNFESNKPVLGMNLDSKYENVLMHNME
jgi:hypothetical protein